jgi:hypothetical protein
MFLVALMAAEKRRWFNFPTGDEFWIVWVDPPIGSWIAIDE